MILTFIFFVLFTTLGALHFISADNTKLLKFVGLFSSSLILILSCFMLMYFDSNFYYFQSMITYKTNVNLLNLDFTFGLDGISILFFCLSNFLVFLCIIFILNAELLKEFLISLTFINLLLLLIFSALDLFIFYVFFEAVLIPMSLLIGLWGSR